MVATQFQNLSEADNTGAIISARGTIFIILWFVDCYLRNGSAKGQGLYDLVRLPREVRSSDDEKASGIWARLENMGNFGDQLVKRQEERKAKKESKKAETEDGEADDESESQDD